MDNTNQICQSCGMPLANDPAKGGTNSDGTKANYIVAFAFADGKFLDEGIDVQGKMEKNIRLAMMKTGMLESDARAWAESVLPQLERWK